MSYQDLQEITAINTWGFSMSLLIPDDETALPFIRLQYEFIKPLIHNPRLQKLLDQMYNLYVEKLTKHSSESVD